MIALDTDVLALYHVFKNDPRYDSTSVFFHSTRDLVKGVTVFNLLELCGIVATARRAEESRMLFDKYLEAQDAAILFPGIANDNRKEFWTMLTSESLSRIQRGMRFGDAVILWTLETNPVESFITWNTRHFRGKTSLKVLNPVEYLRPSRA